MASADRTKKLDVVALMMKPLAYQAFTTMWLNYDESVDVFVADFKPLWELSGHKVVNDEDSVVIQQFLTGLPPDYNRHVRLSLVRKKTTICDCVEIVRALRTSDLDSASWNVTPSASSESTRNTSTGSGSSNVRLGINFKSVLCFRCEETRNMHIIFMQNHAIAYMWGKKEINSL